MNGLKMSANTNAHKQDRHLFLSPANVAIPDTVGKCIFLLNKTCLKYICGFI